MFIPFSTLQIISAVCAFIAFFSAFFALATPSWQVVYAREIDQWIQSGLWLNCQTRPSGMYTCTYAFTKSDFEFYTTIELLNYRSQPFYTWQRNLLIKFLVGQFFIFIALTSLCFYFIKTKQFISSIVNVAALAIAVILHIGSTVAFTILTQMIKYRFYHVSVSGRYEKHNGYSYYIEIFASTLLTLSLILSISHLVIFLKQSKYTNSNIFKHKSKKFLTEEPNLIQQKNFFTSNSNMSENSGFSSTILSNNQLNYSHPQITNSLPINCNNSGHKSQLQIFKENTFAMRKLPKVPDN